MRSRSASRARSPCAVPVASVTPITITPMMTSATRISTSVKPRWRMAAGLLLNRPVADVRVDAFAAFLAVAAQGVEVVAPVLPGTDVDVLLLPRIPAGTRHVSVGFPRMGNRLDGRLLQQRLQALLGGGIARIVEAVQLERGAQRLDVPPRLVDAGIIDTPHDLRGHHRGEQANDHHHHHDLDQREATLSCA